MELLFETLPGQTFQLTLLSLPPHAAVPFAAAQKIPVLKAGSTGEAVALIRKTDPDLVHTHGLRPAVIALRSHPRRWVRTVHSLLSSDYASPLKGLPALWVEKRAQKAADLTIAVSEAVAKERLSLGQDQARLVVIPNAVTLPPPLLQEGALRELAGLPAGAKVALALSRLSPVKGLDNAIRMLGHLPPEWHLVVMGDGSSKADLISLAQSLRLQDRVHLLPYRKGARAFLPQAQVVVIPSRQEGFSLVAIEAQAAGTPVVATRVGGLPEAVGEGGILVPPDSPPDMARAILEAERRASELTRIGHDRYLERFVPEAFSAATRQVFLTILGEIGNLS